MGFLNQFITEGGTTLHVIYRLLKQFTDSMARHYSILREPLKAVMVGRFNLQDSWVQVIQVAGLRLKYSLLQKTPIIWNCVHYILSMSQCCSKPNRFHQSIINIEQKSVSEVLSQCDLHAFFVQSKCGNFFHMGLPRFAHQKNNQSPINAMLGRSIRILVFLKIDLKNRWFQYCSMLVI